MSNYKGKAGGKKLADEEYLSSFGYKQTLNRSIGLFSSFAVQYSGIGMVSVLYALFGFGLSFFGPATFWAFLIGGLLQALLVGPAMAELVSAYPLAGGVYQINDKILGQTNLNRRLSRWVSWQSGWWVAVAHIIAVASVGYLMAPYVAKWFGYNELTQLGQFWWALGLVLLATFINVIHVKASALVNNLGVIAELVAGAVIIAGLLFIHHKTQPASIIFETAGTVQNGNWFFPFIMGFLLPLYMIQSFDATGNAAEETHNAAMTAPLGTLIANVVAVVIGAVMFFLLTLSIPGLDKVMGNSAAGALIIRNVFGETAASVIELVIFVALLACILVLQLTAARIIWSQARDNNIPMAEFLHRVGANRVPINATLMVSIGSIIILIIGVLSQDALVFLTSFTALAWVLAYALTLVIGFYSLWTRALPARPFTAGRFSIWLFALAIIWQVIASLLVIAHDPVKTIVGMLGAIVLGAVLYAFSPKMSSTDLPSSHPAKGDVD